MHSFNNTVGLLLGHIHNVLLGMPQFVHFNLGSILRRYLAYPRIPLVALRNVTGIYPLDFNGEQAPNLESRVSLADATDRYGVPRLKIDWRTSELDRLTLSGMLRELKRAINGCGCGMIEGEEARLNQGDHASCHWAVIILARPECRRIRMPASWTVMAVCIMCAIFMSQVA